MKRRFSTTADEALIAGLIERGEHSQLAQAARRLLSRTPDHPLGLKALAVSAICLGRHDEAIPLLQRGAHLYPGDPEMYSNLAIALASGGKHHESLKNIEMALSIEPQRSEFHANRALALLHLGALDAAIGACRTALQLNPRQANAYNTMGAALHRKREFAEALAAFQAAAQNNPESLDAFANLISTLIELGRLDEAAACARSILDAGDPSGYETAVLLPHLGAAERACCDWRRAELPSALRDIIRHPVDQGPEPFFMTHIEEIDRATLRQGAEVYGRRALAGAGVLALHDGPSDVVRDRPPRPLRIAFLSADFRTHPVSELAVGIYETLDRNRFEIHAYGYGPRDTSPLRRRLEAAFDAFQDIDALSFSDAAALMRRDGVDILVDMNGWTKFSRSGILAHSPAPVAATWLGFPGTLGVKGLAHYLISDAVVTPPDHAGDYAEHLALMPHSYQPSSRVADGGAIPARQDEGLPEGVFVFASFNQSVKITPAVFRVWCELLRRNPSSVLWLGFQSDAAQANLRREAEVLGIAAADRIVFAPWRELPQHIARLPLADLALDTFPYGSHITGSDMLWAGVPLVARLGETFAGRVSASLLKSAGFPELIARSEEEYLALADGLAKRPEHCKMLRERLVNARASAPLFDTHGFSRDLGSLFEAMWQNHLSGCHGPIRLSSRDEYRTAM